MIEKPTVSKQLTPQREFHFPGSGIYVPQTVLAAVLEEAEKIWLQTRQRVAKLEENIAPITNQEDKQV